MSSNESSSEDYTVPYLNESALEALEATRPPYSTYLTAFENIGTLVGRLVTVTLMPYILYCLYFKKANLRVSTLSLTMQGFLFMHSIAAAIAIPYYVYLVVCWRPGMIDDINDFNYSMVYYDLSYLGSSYYSVSAVPIIFLTLERCWVLVAAAHPFLSIGQSAIFYLSVVVFWVPWIINFMVYFGIGTFFNIFGNYLTLVLKIGGDCCSIFFTALFMYLLKRHTTNSSERIKNNLVKDSMYLEIVFGWIPGFGSFVLSYIISQDTLHDYLGPIATFCNAIEMACTSVFYYKLLAKSGKPQKATIVTATQTFRPQLVTHKPAMSSHL